MNTLTKSERLALLDSVKGLVWRLAIRRAGRVGCGRDSYYTDEMVAAGLWGAWRAACMFDAGRGLHFSTLAVRWIRLEMSDWERSNRPSGFKNPARDGIPPAVIPFSLMIANRSLDETLVDTHQKAEAWPEDEWEHLTAGLSERDRTIITMRVRDGETFREISRVVGVTHQQVCNIFKGWAKRVRQTIEHKPQREAA